MRTDLNMRKGKMVAQGAHAAMAFMSHNLGPDRHSGMHCFTPSSVEIEWLNNSFAKVCLGVASEQELRSIMDAAAKAGLTVHSVIDNGTTEFGGMPMLTCCAIGPNYVEEIDKITGGLKLL